MKKTTSEQFCHDLLELDIKYAKAFTNTVIALGSSTCAQSPVQLSESPLFHHQYSSLRDGIHGVGLTKEEQSATMASVRSLGLAQVLCDREEWIILQTDATSVIKAYSKSLEDRQYVKIANNVIKSNKPISIGYPISLVNISIPPLASKWSVPLSMQRISSTQTANECAVSQVKELLTQENLQLAQYSVLNTLDSGYGCPEYIEPTYEHENLVNVVRFRYGKKIWLPASSSTSTTGAPKIYGKKYYLIDVTQTKIYHRKSKAYEVYQESIFDLKEDDYIELSSQTSKGRALTIMVWRWTNVLIRSKAGHNMKDKDFDVVASKVVDSQTGELVFQKTMFTTIHGKRKDEISTEQAFETYRHRYDIEPAIKFCKQNLLLEKYQTSEVQHFDNWLVVVMTAFWLLFAASKDVNYQPKKWQQYKCVNKAAVKAQSTPNINEIEQNIKSPSELKENRPRLSPNQTKQAAEALFLTFDNAPFLPQKSKKGLGRKKGDPGSQKSSYSVVKKTSKKPKTKLTDEKRE